MSKTPPEKYALALRDAIAVIPEAYRNYLLNFVTKNAHRPTEDLLARLGADLAARAEAEKIQRHRDEKVMGDALEAAKRLGVDVAITGVPADAASETVRAKG